MFIQVGLEYTAVMMLRCCDIRSGLRYTLPREAWTLEVVCSELVAKRSKQSSHVLATQRLALQVEKWKRCERHVMTVTRIGVRVKYSRPDHLLSCHM
jgi:hypothetical protein